MTRLVLSSEVDIAGPRDRKTAEDVNGGRLAPGDTVRFTIAVSNRGTSGARVFLDDTLPEEVEACAVTSVHPEILCEGNGRVRGFLNVAGGETQRVVLTTQVRNDAANGSRIQNTVVLSASGQRVERRSNALVVESAPDLQGATKAAVGPVNGTAGTRTNVSIPNSGMAPAICRRPTSWSPMPLSMTLLLCGR